jgi:hypothetical protein
VEIQNSDAWHQNFKLAALVPKCFLASFAKTFARFAVLRRFFREGKPVTAKDAKLREGYKETVGSKLP